MKNGLWHSQLADSLTPARIKINDQSLNTKSDNYKAIIEKILIIFQ